jgi:hypothetical protein
MIRLSDCLDLYRFTVDRREQLITIYVPAQDALRQPELLSSIERTINVNIKKTAMPAGLVLAARTDKGWIIQSYEGGLMAVVDNPFDKPISGRK